MQFTTIIFHGQIGIIHKIDVIFISDMIKPQKLAVFDIDGTIFRSSLVIELSHALVDAGIFPKSARKEIETEYLAWVNRKGSYEAYINKVVKIYIKLIADKRFSQVKRVAQSVINFQKDRVYMFTRDLIKKLKAENYLLIAISGSPSYIVSAYAKAIGFDLFFGTELEVKSGKFTGKVLNVDSAYNKAKIVKDVAKKYSISLNNSIAVGDTEGDIAMLSLVGNPIAFNPNLHLAKIAQKKKWRMVAERKDVIYEIKSFEFLND
jgi:HAD superfamily hydrolase (TIGR01490 family)